MKRGGTEGVVVSKEVEPTTPEKYRIVIKGNVINVGYRAFVRQVAMELEIGGLVRNKKNYVEIYCQVENKAHLNIFLNRLTNIRKPQETDFYDPFQIKILDEPKIFKEDSDEYKNNSPPEKFDMPFMIDFDEDINNEIVNSLNVGKAIMNTKFNYLDYKYDKISKTLEEGVSIKGVDDIAKAFGKALEEHDMRIIELLKSKK